MASGKNPIRNFLTDIRERKGSAGTSPEDAFSIQVGSGETLTPGDIPDNIIRITVPEAVIHPAYYTEITLQQQMQKRLIIY